MRIHLFHTAALGALFCLAPVLVQAQTVYRCGNAYSQVPCPGASTIAADDRRTPEQKAQTDAAAAQASRQADRMERERLARERVTDGARSKSAAADAHARTKAPNKAKARATPAKKKSEMDYFSASTGRSNKKTPAAKPEN